MLALRLAAALLSCTALATAAEPLRVLTFNLRYINQGDTGNHTWTVRRDAAAEVILKDKPDIIGIQEGLRPMLDDIAERIDGYVEIGSGREDGLAKGEYSALLVRADRFTIQDSGTFWLSDTPEIPGSTSWGNQVVRVCTWAKLYDRRNQRAFQFFNTHLDHRSQPARQKGTELILSRMAGRGDQSPVIFTGDFNAAPENPLHTLIKSAPGNLSDIWATLNPGVKPEESGTCHPFDGKTNGARIDYIYASDSFIARESSVLHFHRNGVYPSDHFPIRATLDFKEAHSPPPAP